MRSTFDFSPLFRSSVGFDRMLNALEAANRMAPAENWPPYDIVKSGEDDYRIVMAVAGFSEKELTITHEQNMLIVTSEKADEDEKQYLHRGIPSQAFERRFELADYVKVTAAKLVDGLLTIDLKREIPEEMKPHRIEITDETAPRQGNMHQIEAEAAA
ncbi:molecular chaperone IbpA [Rhizobium azibense]|nr:MULTISPECIES: Hsp20 family protein [Rhizobium]TCU29319.1 molecular chaperone IbpA [Rhizobium azibense]TCU37961.1 molecular chaperone IbpA [Rhizobium azibense]